MQSLLPIERIKALQDSRDKQENEEKLAELIKIVKRIEEYTSTDLEQFTRSNLVRDAVMFNLAELQHVVLWYSIRFRSAELEALRKTIIQPVRDSRKAGRVEPTQLWDVATKNIKELVPLIRQRLDNIDAD